ncbi:winged helix-turn-helix domain-containing protein [Neolewinella persica]|uniref:winged helix-turn-helix domain-containing protein n=1 Tax=Neolewinella persica TaxID=70998 RepID=UPI00146A0922|nr:helix-turn-helix domain-containing protein [Neolewinella persica]
MRNWLLRWSPALGLVLVLVTLTSTLAPTAPVGGHPQGSLALRQIGHDYLSGLGDHSSTIPAVVHRPDGSLFLQLERHLDYDTISAITAKVFAHFNITDSYTLSLEDCETGEVFLGGFWKGTKGLELSATGLEIACAERDQPIRCASLSISFPPPAAPLSGPLPWLLLGLGCLLMIAGPTWQRLQAEPTTTTPEAAEVMPVSDHQKLGNNCSFSLADQSLEVGDVSHELTYREAKLFSFLATNTNQVLDRETIHDAVWGEEGIMVGRSLDVFISRLRKKISGAKGLEIQTVHGIGYRLRTT